MAKRVYFDDSELKVETDNAIVNKDGTNTVLLNGNFDIGSNDVVKLLALVNKLDSRFYKGYGWVSSKKDLIDSIKYCQETNEDYRNENNRLYEENQKLKKEIEKLNSNWWYRLWHH